MADIVKRTNGVKTDEDDDVNIRRRVRYKRTSNSEVVRALDRITDEIAHVEEQQRQGAKKNIWRDVAVFSLTFLTMLAIFALAWAIREGNRMSQQAFRESHRAFVFLKSNDRRIEKSGDDYVISWTQTWHNSGNTAPLNLTIWNECSDEASTVKLDFGHKTGLTRVTIGPGADAVLPGCAQSYNYLTALDRANIAQAVTLPRFTYLYGGAEYDDVFGHKHRYQYCYQLWFNDRSVDFGFTLSPCVGVNEGHNCTDDECGKTADSGQNVGLGDVRR